MAKIYKNINELVKSLSGDKKFKDQTLKELHRKNIAQFLFTLRCKHSLTQAGCYGLQYVG